MTERQSFNPEKRPHHVMLIGDHPVTASQLEMLTMERKQCNIKNITVMNLDCFENTISEDIKICHLDRSNNEFITNLRSKGGKLPPYGIPVDLLISTQTHLDLSGLDGTVLGFAEICHIPKGQFINKKVWNYALSQYANCRQNYGS